MTISRKISPYIIQGTTVPLRRADAKPTFVMMVDCSVAYHAQMRALMGPDVLIEMRWTEPNDYQPLDDPERRADEWWERRKGAILAIPAGDNTIFAGYNEIGTEQAAAFARFERRRMAHLHGANRRAAVGSWSVGRPDTDEWAIYAPLLASMHPGDVLDLHEYASDLADIDNRWHIGRFTIPAIAANLGDWPMVISEFGYDYTPDTGKGKPGWQLQPGANNETCLAMLRKGGAFYDTQPRVIGVAAYQMGSVDPKFAAFNMWGVWPSVVAEYGAPITPPVSTPVPPPSTTPTPSLSLVPPIDKANVVRISQPWNPPTHYGIDFSCVEGKPIYAPLAGYATKRDQPSGFGRYVRIETDRYVAFVCHLSLWTINDGPVVAGQEVGRSGNTGNSSGPHLHLEVRDKRGSPYLNGAVDPTLMILWPVFVPPVVVPPVVTPAALEAYIGTAMQEFVIPLNSAAALEKAGAVKGYLPASDEKRIVYEGVTYVCQVFRNSADRLVQHIARCVEGDWGNVVWFTRTN